MEIPSFRRVLTSFALIGVLYLAFLAAWIPVRGAYARAAASAVTHGVFPLLSMKGGVRVGEDNWIRLVYTVPDGRTGEWGTMRQRFLDFSDLPLAAAASLGLLLLGWRRRLVVLSGSLVAVFLCHLGLIVLSARRFTEILARADLDAASVDRLMTEASTGVTGFGNISSVVTLGIVGALTALLATRRKTRRGGMGREA